MSRVMRWIDQELASDQKLAERVELQLTRLSVAQALVALREQQGVSRRTLARRVGVSQSVITRVESGHKGGDLGLRMLVRIASALNGEVQITIRRRPLRRHETLERLRARP